MTSIYRNNTAGFSLLELLISMVILVLISFAIYTATTQTYRLRDSLTVEGDFYNSIRLSMFILNKDISMMYSPLSTLSRSEVQNLNSTTPPDPQRMQTYMAEDMSQPSTFWSAAIQPSGLRPSRFIGTENKISFVSLSHVRIYKDANESDFSRITYELKKGKTVNDASTSTLVKTETVNAFITNDSARDQLGRSYELLEGVKRLSYTYYQRDGNTWRKLNTWDSEREETRYRFPDVIEVKMEVVGDNRMTFEGVFKFRPEIALNGIEASQ